MSEVSFPKVLWERDTGSAGAMESCYKLYTWINHTVLMLLIQIIWKVSQISDFLTGKSSQPEPEMMITFTPLTKESKYRRHIRSMSDVQNSTPYRIAFRSRKGSNHSLMYDSDTRTRRIRTHYKHELPESSDSSDFESSKNIRSLGHNIIKHTDSMRIL